VSRAILRDSLSVALTVGVYGIAFGAAAVEADLSVLQACVLSLLAFTGASQFAVVGVLGAGGSALSAITAASLLGVRNSFYGLRMAPILQVRGVKRFAAAQITIDESTAVSVAQEDKGLAEMRLGFWATGIGVYIFWNLFTLLGALGATALGDPASWGLDAAVPAAFLGLLWPRLISKSARIVALISIFLCTLLIPFAAAGVPVIACALVPFIFAFMGDRK
jgi:predicted branched-subunit amino acid permease